jgi:predicted DsbA family dithiol-disulfide isomerase
MSALTLGNKRTFELDIVSDVICPWCYVGKRRLEQALERIGPEIAIDVRWRPFELNPTMPPGGIDREVYCIRKFGSLEYGERLYANVAANAHADGLPMEYERIARVPNTRAAHRLIWFAEQHEAQDAVVDGLFAAYFVDGRDIGDPNVLTEVAVSAGLERERVEGLLGSDEGDELVDSDEMEARRLGIDGVPAFLLNGRYIFSGAQTPETIALAIEQAIDRG